MGNNFWLEEWFINSYISRNIRNRYLVTLCSEKKSLLEKGLARLDHSIEHDLIHEKLERVGRAHLHSRMDELKSSWRSKNSYVRTLLKEYDKLVLNTELIVRELCETEYGGIVFVECATQLVIVFSEEDAHICGRDIQSF